MYFILGTERNSMSIIALDRGRVKPPVEPHFLGGAKKKGLR